MKTKKLYGIIFLLILISGCQQLGQQKSKWVRNRGQDYLVSGVIAPLRVPSNLSQPNASENFPLPPSLPSKGTLSTLSLAPPDFEEFKE